MQGTENEKGEITQQQSFATPTILLQSGGGLFATGWTPGFGGRGKKLIPHIGRSLTN